ncbi:hypothetical protein ACP4OV_017715 [Aristida adscensionis]
MKIDGPDETLHPSPHPRTAAPATARLPTLLRILRTRRLRDARPGDPARQPDARRAAAAPQSPASSARAAAPPRTPDARPGRRRSPAGPDAPRRRSPAGPDARRAPLTPRRRARTSAAAASGKRRAVTAPAPPRPTETAATCPPQRRGRHSNLAHRVARCPPPLPLLRRRGLRAAAAGHPRDACPTPRGGSSPPFAEPPRAPSPSPALPLRRRRDLRNAADTNTADAAGRRPHPRRQSAAGRLAPTRRRRRRPPEPPREPLAWSATGRPPTVIQATETYMLVSILGKEVIQDYWPLSC